MLVPENLISLYFWGFTVEATYLGVLVQFLETIHTHRMKGLGELWEVEVVQTLNEFF